MNLSIKHIERIWLDVPFREVPARNMIRELPHWTLSELCHVTLENGVTGIGETMPYYTWGEVTDESVKRAMGKVATEIMWDDALGAGLQMALFDAVAKSNEIPIHHLLGEQVRQDAPVSWWSIEMCLEDWLLECREALAQGYVSYKYKARPWFDLVDQVRTVTKEMPPHFEIDLDFNTMCCDSAHGVRVLKELERFHQIKIFESPIPQGDVAGNKYLRSQTHVPIAMHVGNPPLTTALQEDVCDGFVICAGASAILHQARCISEANKVFWLQLVGTGITAAWSTHFAAVSSHVRWPAVTCDNLYQHRVVQNAPVVTNGLVPVPQAPGLGVEIDPDAVERFRIEPVKKPYPHPDLLIRVSWPSGAEDFYAHGLQYWDDFTAARKPVFSPGVHMEIVPDDGTDHWRTLYNEALKKPNWEPRDN